MRLFDGAILAVIAILAFTALLNTSEIGEPQEKTSDSKEVVLDGPKEKIIKDPNPDLDNTGTDESMTGNSSIDNDFDLYKYLSVILLIVLIVVLLNLRKKNKRLLEINNELDQLKDRLSQLKVSVDTKSPDKLLLQQVVFTLRSFNSYLEKVDSSNLDFFELSIFELKSILSNTGCKEIIPQVGQSVLKDSELAQKVSIVGKKKSETYQNQIGIITEIVNLGYETKEGELILTAEVIVTSK
ncbi:MAG: hypothetical protein HOF02_08070 [Gammaproteobacteria bacterium]|jgi:hypothetical protein|nr:hypothetical protein [bacterium]MBT3993990.1 hypothetical protein [Gammaproteobacteria bacterium]